MSDRDFDAPTVPTSAPRNVTYGSAPSKPTPLPKFQIFIISLIQFSEPITAVVIYPFVNQFVRDTGVIGGDERKTGYYAGIIESAFFFAEAMTVVYWGWLSDRFGRRPVILFGPVGLAIAMLGFGLSSSFWPLVVFRCLQGVFNGNIGVSKSMVAEITDDTNIGDAFALMPLMWSFGTTIAPIIGGVFTSPATRWPDTLGKISVLRNHPYFLPCLVSASIAVLTFIIAFIGLKETLSSAIARKKQKLEKSTSMSTPSNQNSSLITHGDCREYGSMASESTVVEEGLSTSTISDKNPPPLRSLLVPKVVLTLLAYMFLVFVDMSYMVLSPLVFSTSIPLGGLGLTPYQIGMTLGIWGLCNAVLQLTCLGRIIRKFGPRRVFRVTYHALMICIGSFPLSIHFAKQAGYVDARVCAVVFVQLLSQSMLYMAYGAIHILIVRSAPDKSSLGATNGLAQMLGCIFRSLAPTIASSLFSISLERHLAGGNLVFILLLTIAAIGSWVSSLLPKA